MPSKISEEELLQGLREFAEDLGETPTVAEMRDSGPYGTGPYSRAFGSWNAALLEAGLEPNHRVNISDGELCGELRDLADELGHPPSINDLKDSGEFSYRPYIERWGTMRDAREAAGLERDVGGGYDVTDEELIRGFNEFADQLGKTPTAKEMAKDGPYTKTVYQIHFGSWADAVREAGHEPGSLWNSQIELTCPQCNGTFSVAPSQAPDRTYCSRQCHDDWKSENLVGENHWSWKDGGDLYYGDHWQETRSDVLNRDNHRCQSCGVAEDAHRDRTGKGLHIHHVKPLRTFDDAARANRLNNLVTLCRSCHRRWEGVPVRPTLA